jgi:hypothetical protein
MDSNAFQLRLATVPILDDILRDGARRALQAAIEREVQEYIDRNSRHLDDRGRRLVVRNGHHPARKIQSGSGDGALGFWKALRQVYPSTRHQRCWVHKTVNVLDKLPKNQQPAAKDILHEIWMAATRSKARSRRCGYERAKPRAPAAGRRAWRWRSSWWNRPRITGGSSTAARCSRRSSPV